MPSILEPIDLFGIDTGSLNLMKGLHLSKLGGIDYTTNWLMGCCIVLGKPDVLFNHTGTHTCSPRYDVCQVDDEGLQNDLVTQCPHG